MAVPPERAAAWDDGPQEFLKLQAAMSEAHIVLVR